MIYDVQISNQAEIDLRSIFEYIAYNLRSLQNAVGQLKRLEESISSLDQIPERFKAYQNEPWHSRGLRVMSVDNYLVFYIPDSQTKSVNVLRVMYGGRDVDAQLRILTETLHNAEE